MFKRTLSILASFLGFLGLVGCLAMIAALWIGGARLSQTTENVFGEVDKSFIVVRSRVSQTRERLQESRITTDKIEQSLKEWSKREARQRLASRLDVEEKAERLADALVQADQWLALSASSTEIVQQALSLGSSAGAPVDGELADQLLEEIESLRHRLGQATELVERIRDRAADDRGEKTLEERINQAAQLALRLFATLSSIDARLVKLESKVSDVQEEVQRWKATTLQWILIATIGISLLTVWMAAGQVLLCLHGWKGLRPSRTGRPRDESLAS